MSSQLVFVIVLALATDTILKMALIDEDIRLIEPSCRLIAPRKRNFSVIHVSLSRIVVKHLTEEQNRDRSRQTCTITRERTNLPRSQSSVSMRMEEFGTNIL